MSDVKGGALMGLVDALTAEGLKELRQEIAKTEVWLKKARGLEKIAKHAIEGKKKTPKQIANAPLSAGVPNKEPSEDKPEVVQSRSLDVKRRGILKFLLEKPRTGHDIITTQGVAPAKLAETMNCNWFEKDGGLWRLTETGILEANHA